MIKLFYVIKELFSCKSYWYYTYCQSGDNGFQYGWGVQISYTPYFDACNYHTWNESCVPFRINRITKKQYIKLKEMLKSIKDNEK